MLLLLLSELTLAIVLSIIAQLLKQSSPKLHNLAQRLIK